MVFRILVKLLFFMRRLLVIPLWLGPIYLTKKLRKRFLFELKSSHSVSFKQSCEVADIAFEVSSEGELEQSRPLIDFYLQQGKKVELIFASPSVEKKCSQLALLYPDQLRLFRLPIVVFWKTIFSWATAKHLVLCRYDFYPQLLLYGMRKNYKLTLISATLKNKKDSWFLRNLYRKFDQVVAATEADRKRISHWCSHVVVYDFRIIQIMKRIYHFDEIWTKLSFSDQFEKIYSKVDRNSRLILGSCWPVDMDIFADESFRRGISSGEFFVVLAPHQLNVKSLSDIRDSFKRATSSQLEIYHIAPEMTFEDVAHVFSAYENKRGVFMLTLPGILCELYTHFGHAYVGGGFGRSIHSVLEPYLAGSSVICGPKVYRSTEYDMISETSLHLINTIERPFDYFRMMEKAKDFRLICEKRIELIDNVQHLFHNIIDQLDGDIDAQKKV